jgi:hypothetical protein
MGKGVKIALGCGCLVLLVIAGVVAMFGFGAFWAKSKLTEFSGGIDNVAARSREIDDWAAKANSVPYEPPENGVLTEPRLLGFLEVRKSVFAVYQRYETELRDMQAQAGNEGRPPSLSQALATGGRFAEAFGQLRLAQVKALAEQGMSESEYRDIQLAVYKTAWAAEAQKAHGKLPSEAVGHAGDGMAEALETTMAEAEKTGVPGASQLSDEQRQQLRETMQKAAEATKAIEAPQPNIDLFRRHEGEIRKYAMTGLDLLGF